MTSRFQLGFTVLETLIVLSLTISILSITLSYTFKTYDTFQYKQFIEQFNQDLLYLQQLAITKKETYYLHFDRRNHRYHIRKAGIGERIAERTYPNHWTVEPNTLSLPIEYSKKGNLKNPGTMKVTTKYRQYLITCPFGKGRCYDEKA